VAKKKSARAERRERERSLEKLHRQREKLAALEPGGSPERPVDLESASLVEPRARAEPCLRCGGEMRSVEHRAEALDRRRLRIAVARCARCGHARTFYFRLVPSAPS
jgi:hypothetical protein